MLGPLSAVRILAGATLAILAAAACFAHEGIDATLQDIDALLARGPESADLYLRRGELHRLAGRTGEAFADYARARTLDPTLTVLELCQAAAERDAGDVEGALRSVRRYLSCEPGSPAGYELRARLHAAAGHAAEAVAAYDRAIDLCLPPTDPDPDWFLERARLESSRDDRGVDRALAGLEAGLGRLGPVVTLELLALDLETAHGRTDAALARLARLVARAPRREVWLARRGAFLERVGRIADAREAYEEAREAAAEVTPARRQASAFVELEASIAHALARLSRDAPSEEARP